MSESGAVVDVADRSGRAGGTREGSDATRVRDPALAAAASAVFSLTYVALGPGYVLDDWFAVANAHFDGSWASAGASQQVARPGAAVVYWFVFGVIGPHPLAAALLQAAIGAATAALLVCCLRRFVGPGLALLVGVLWAVLPNHTSLTMWISATNIALCTLFAVLGTWWLADDRRSRAVAGLVAFGLAALCYEAIIPLAAVLVVVVPWVRRGRWDLRVVLGGAAVLGGVSLWVATHWHPDKHVEAEVADLSQAIGAHLGWGIAPAGPVAQVLTAFGLIGVGLALARGGLWITRRRRMGEGDLLVLAGLVVVVLGTIPFAKYLYAPLGAGDRYNFVSAVGGAMIWAGIAAMLAVWRRPLAVILVGALLVAGAVEHVQRALLWHRAGADAVAIQQGVVATIPRPGGVIVLGPTPIQQQNIAAYLDPSNIDGALAVAYGTRDVSANFSADEAAFQRVPPGTRFDIRPVSQLQP